MITIVNEDEEFESFIMNGHGDIAVPFCITEKNGDFVITVYSRFADVAKEFSAAYADRPFSTEARNFISEKLDCAMRAAGFVHSDEDSPITVRYEIELSALNKELLGEYETVMISTNAEFERYHNDIYRDAEFDDGDDNDVCFAVIKDGCIVSFAGVNDIRDEGCLDINVETSEMYRKQGYGSAVTAALANYLLKKGECVCYNCLKSNTASCRTAERAGFVKQSTVYSHVYYADTE